MKPLLVCLLLGSFASATSIFDPVTLYPANTDGKLGTGIVLSDDINPLISPANGFKSTKFIYISYRGFEVDTDWSGTLTIEGFGSFTESGHFDLANACFPRPPGCRIFPGIAWDVPLNFYRPKQAAIQLNFGGVISDPYHFQIVEPVPEVDSFLLTASGLGLLGLFKFRSRYGQRRNFHPCL